MIGTLTKTETQINDAFFADILAAINGDEQPSAAGKLLSTEPINLRQKLNPPIARGITFHISADKFHLGNAHLATTEDIEFLRNYSTGILCILQQGLLTKWIFNDAPTFLADFRHEIAERELLMTVEEGKGIANEIHEQAVIEVTKSWFADVFKEIL